MKKHLLHLTALFLLIIITCITESCSKEVNNPVQSQGATQVQTPTQNQPSQPPPTSNNYSNVVPKFVATNYIELDKIFRISKFRSSIGHDYSDDIEHCRSMKHYFQPPGNVDWNSIKIYSPVTGIISIYEQEWAGYKIEITSAEHPEYRFCIFHVNALPHHLGDTVTAGELLGNHIGSQTMSDISVLTSDSTGQRKFISFFDVITDSLFNQYQLRGISKREDMIIPKALRDANPLSCNGETFNSTDTLENWVLLQ